MSDKKRRWFQVHLSTAIVMMVVAGGFVFLNLQLSFWSKYFACGKLSSESGHDYGFPLPWYSSGVGYRYTDETWSVIKETTNILNISWDWAALNAAANLVLVGLPFSANGASADAREASDEREKAAVVSDSSFDGHCADACCGRIVVGKRIIH